MISSYSMSIHYYLVVLNFKMLDSTRTRRLWFWGGVVYICFLKFNIFSCTTSDLVLKVVEKKTLEISSYWFHHFIILNMEISFKFCWECVVPVYTWVHACMYVYTCNIKAGQGGECGDWSVTGAHWLWAELKSSNLQNHCDTLSRRISHKAREVEQGTHSCAHAQSRGCYHGDYRCVLSLSARSLCFCAGGTLAHCVWITSSWFLRFSSSFAGLT